MTAERAEESSSTFLGIAIPSILQSLCEWSRPLVLLHFVALNSAGETAVTAGSSMSAADVSASAGLALTFFQVVVSYPTYGFASAFDTLTSQAFGSKRTELIATDLRIIWLLALGSTFLTSLLLLAIATYLAPIVAPANSDLDGGGLLLLNRFLLVLSPCIPATILWNILTRWLRAQHQSWAAVVGVVLGASLNLILNLPLLPSSSSRALSTPVVGDEGSGTKTTTMQPLLMAFSGSGWSPREIPFLALCIANMAMVIPVLVQTFLVRRNLLLGCGGGVTDLEIAEKQRSPAAAVSDFSSVSTLRPRLLQVLHLGAQGVMLTCGEIWCWEIQMLFATALGPASTAAYSICFNFYSFLVMVPVGLRNGLAAMIGFHVGRGSASGAQEALLFGLRLGGGILLVYFLGLMLLGGKVAALFSESEEVQSLVVQSLRVIAAYQVCDGAYIILVGALTGVGQQGAGAVATLAFYLVGIPFALGFAFALQGGTAGLWLGMGLANILVFLIVLRKVRKLDFAEEVDQRSGILRQNSGRDLLALRQQSVEERQPTLSQHSIELKDVRAPYGGDGQIFSPNGLIGA